MEPSLSRSSINDETPESSSTFDQWGSLQKSQNGIQSAWNYIFYLIKYNKFPQLCVHKP
jgi:hypothetical protein